MSAPDESSASSERPCGITSFIPIGMSCRGRAEAFARRLQSRLRTLGSQVRTNFSSNKRTILICDYVVSECRCRGGGEQ